MNTIIGIDTHISTCDYYAVNNAGSLLEEGTVKTNAFQLRKTLKEIKGKDKVVVIEQGPLASWLGRILRPYVSRLVVSEPRRNRWIANDPVKFDRFDAEKLTVLYRGGCIKEITQRKGDNELLLRMVLQHHDLTNQRTRIKNKIKAKFRENGMRASGISVFNEKKRLEWLTQLSTNSSLVYPVNTLYAQLDFITNQLEDTDTHLRDVIKQYPITKVLINKFQGIGLINAATFVALVDTPHRFPTVKKFWTYCGLGLDIRTSGLKRGVPRLTSRGNRLLKGTLKQATITAIHKGKENPYRTWYESSLQLGMADHKALLTCARKLSKDMWLTWKRIS